MTQTFLMMMLLICLKNSKKKDCFFDLIVANPPYAGTNKNKPLSNKFIESSIDPLKENGYLLFIVPCNFISFNNNNTTLKKLNEKGNFLVLDFSAKQYFKQVGNSFCIFLWQKRKDEATNNLKTIIFNSYFLQDKQEIEANYLKTLPFLPLYLSKVSISLCKKMLNLDDSFNNGFTCSSLLHNYTKRQFLSNKKDEVFKYKTIHTPTKIRYSKIKLDIYGKWLVIVPLTTYFKPYLAHCTNVTQSVGYFAFENKQQANNFCQLLNQDYIKVLIYWTRFGNFNNLQVLKHLKIMNKQDANNILNKDEQNLIKNKVLK